MQKTPRGTRAPVGSAANRNVRNTVPANRAAGRGMTGTGNRRRGGILGNLLVLLLIVFIVLIVLINMIPWWVLIVMLVGSIAGMAVVTVLRQHQPTPEEEKLAMTIEKFNTGAVRSREGLHQLAVLAVSQIKPVSMTARLFNQNAKYQIWLNEVWRVKCQKIIDTASMALSNDAQGLAAISQLVSRAGIKV